MRSDDDERLLVELEPVAAQLLDRHLRVQREWFPHEYIPYSAGRDFDREPWTPDHSRLTGVAQIAFEMNLLTEDNLPSYHREIAAVFGRRDSAWMAWVHRWTAEEARHSIVLRDYLVVTRAVDPVALERGRMAVVSTGYEDRTDLLRGIAYVSFQELATRISHRNTGRFSNDPVADRIMARISADENLHMVFYRDLMEAVIQSAPSAAVRAIAAEVRDFAMPGAGMPSFRTKAARIALAGIYDVRSHHDDVIWPLLRHWRIFQLEGLDGEAEKARCDLSTHLTELDESARRYEEKRDRRAGRRAPARA